MAGKYNGISMTGFPVFDMKSGDIARSWREFTNEFDLAVRMRTLELGTETYKDAQGQDARRPRFSEEAKLLALMRSVGQEGRETLLSEGLSISTPNLTYAQVFEVLKKNYERKESLYVRTQKFVTIVQCAGEDYGSYLCRVERLSRDLDFFNHAVAATNKSLQDARSTLALVIAVNGLRDKTLCRELIAKADLNWETLNDILRARGAAQQSVELLQNESLSPVVVKQEPMERDVGAVVKQQEGRKDRYPARRYDRSSSGERGGSSWRERGYGNQVYQKEGKQPTNNSYSSGGSSKYEHRSRAEGRRYDGFRSNGNDRRGRSGSRDSSRSNFRSGSRDRSYGSERGAVSGPCYECGETGHVAKNCPVPRCYQCGKKGHMARDCGRLRCWVCGGPHRAEVCQRSRSPSPYRGRSPGRVQFLETMVNRKPSDDYDS